RAARAPLPDGRVEVPAVTDGVVAVLREVGPRLDRAAVVDEEGRQVPVGLEGRGDLVVVRERADAARAEAGDGDVARGVGEGRDDLVHRELDVPVAALLDGAHRR